MRKPSGTRLRYYHFGATLVAIGIAMVALAWVETLQDTASSNLQNTYCNQGLLTLAALDVWYEDKIALCPEDLQVQLREKYNK